MGLFVKAFARGMKKATMQTLLSLVAVERKVRVDKSRVVFSRSRINVITTSRTRYDIIRQEDRFIPVAI